MSALTRGRGRPPGSKKDILKDPDRYVVSMARGLVAANPSMLFEHAACFAITFHKGHQIALPINPISRKRKLKFSPDAVARLESGWALQRWSLPEGAVLLDNQVRRLRLKYERWQTVFAEDRHDRKAERWFENVSRAWACVFAPAGFSKWTVVASFAEQACEVPYFEAMLPRLLTTTSEPSTRVVENSFTSLP